jgi:hypothetical protein
MRTVTRTEFKQWQALPALSLGERENSSPSECETGRNICPTAPRKTQSCRTLSSFSAETGRKSGSTRETQQP